MNLISKRPLDKDEAKYFASLVLGMNTGCPMKQVCGRREGGWWWWGVLVLWHYACCMPLHIVHFATGLQKREREEEEKKRRFAAKPSCMKINAYPVCRTLA
jgi:hypothetical protein